MRSLPQSREPLWAPGTDTGFRQRCASAITHPITVVALATLLLNDLLFKAMWPDAWVTGKLSDLAWVVFALPLLAFLLSLFTRGNVVAARAAFLTSYIGLPLLYAAFNTFEPVHYWILRGISLASGGMGRTPLDATDSIVIPLGWAVATWVWRRPALGREALRLRWGLLVAGVAMLASIATSAPEPDYGITRVGVGTTDDGIVVVAQPMYGAMYSSYDGGVTWTKDSTELNVVWGSDSVLTPRGRYTVEGADIVLLARDLQIETVYSTAYLSKSGNLWAQAQQTKHLDARVLETQPQAIVYDELRGNLIVALGIQGVLVGTPDGRWTPHAVGRYKPSDFSFLTKARLLLTDASIWFASLALSLSMIGLSLFLSRITYSDWAGCGALTLVIISVLSSAVFMLNAGGPDDRYIYADFPNFLPAIVGVIAYFTAVGSITFSLEYPQRIWPVVLGGVVILVVLVFLTFMLLLHFGNALGTAQLSSIVLAALVAFLLAGYIRKKTF